MDSQHTAHFSVRDGLRFIVFILTHVLLLICLLALPYLRTIASHENTADERSQLNETDPVIVPLPWNDLDPGESIYSAIFRGRSEYREGDQTIQSIIDYVEFNHIVSHEECNRQAGNYYQYSTNPLFWHEGRSTRGKADHHETNICVFTTTSPILPNGFRTNP
jgi:hypothetical protein